MNLIERIDKIRSKYVMSGLSDTGLSLELRRIEAVDGLNVIEYNDSKVFFDVPQESWNHNTIQYLMPCEFSDEERKVVEDLKRVAERFGLSFSTSTDGVIFWGGSVRVPPQYLDMEIKSKVLSKVNKDELLCEIAKVAYTR